MSRGLGLVFLTILVSGCGFFSKSSSDSPNGDQLLKEEAINTEGATILSVTEGELAGTEVSIPAGALEIEGSVAVTQVGAPASFTQDADISTASQPLKISVTASDGSAVERLSKPMTLSIPIGDSLSLVEAVEKSESNLCVLLEGLDGKKIVWRRTSLTLNVDRTKASVTSISLGIFQVVFCGQKELPDFEDVESTDVATGEQKDYLAIVTVPAKHFDFGHKFTCGTIMGADSFDNFESTAEYFSTVRVDYNGTDSVLRFPLPEGKTANDLDKSVFLLSVNFWDEPGCDEYNGKTFEYWFEQGAPMAPNGISFSFEKDDFINKSTFGVVGTAGSKFEMKEMEFKVGTPDDSRDYSAVNHGKFCLGVGESFAGNTLEIKDGKVYNSNGNEVSKLFLNSDATMSLDDIACNERTVGGSGPSDELFGNFVKKNSELDSLNVLPITLKVENGYWNFTTETWSTEDTSPTGTDQTCIQMYLGSQITIVGSSFNPSSNNDDFVIEMKRRVETDTDGKTTYSMIVPYISEDQYYIRSRPNGNDCDGNVSYSGPYTSANLANWLAAIDVPATN